MDLADYAEEQVVGLARGGHQPTAPAPRAATGVPSASQVVGPHVTRQVREPERQGLVRRVADPRDRRAGLIEPTRKAPRPPTAAPRR